jgi:hypothetical protein
MTIAAEIRTNLLAIVAAYRRATGLSIATVSARFYGNAGFLSEFKAGRQTISVDKLDEMVAKFRAEWPENAEWPYLGAMFMDRPRKRRKTAEERAHAGG